MIDGRRTFAFDFADVTRTENSDEQADEMRTRGAASSTVSSFHQDK